MSKIKLWLCGKALMWLAKHEGMTEDEIESGLMVCSVKEAQEWGMVK